MSLPERRRVYPELSSLEHHKFYEVIVSGTELRLRWGRIGGRGRMAVRHCQTLAEARGRAARKIRQKRRRGYRGAVEGVRPPRPVTRRLPPPPDPRQASLF